MACRLMLVAWGLTLVACGLRGLELDAWSLQLDALLHVLVWPRAPFGAGPSLSSIWDYDTLSCLRVTHVELLVCSLNAASKHKTINSQGEGSVTSCILMHVY